MNVNANEDGFLHDFDFKYIHDAGYLDVDLRVDYGVDDEVMKRILGVHMQIKAQDCLRQELKIY